MMEIAEYVKQDILSSTLSGVVLADKWCLTLAEVNRICSARIVEEYKRNELPSFSPQHG